MGLEQDQRPLLSVVVAAVTCQISSEECLRAVEAQAGPDVEVIVLPDVDTDDGPDAADPSGTRSLAPELWTRGLQRVNGTIVALTTTSVVPQPGWAAALVEAHGSEVAAVGGAIEPPLGNRTADWAVYFCRYSRYMLPFADGGDVELPGDNVAYRREVLASYTSLFSDGFWEPRVHEAMRADGRTLLLDPRPVVRQATGMRVGSFSKQRFLHGRAHGSTRAANYPWHLRILRSASEVLVPFLMTARVLRILLARRRHLARVAGSLPLLFWFFTCWAAGELVGTWSRPEPR